LPFIASTASGSSVNDLDRLRGAFGIEIELRLGERHEDDRRQSYSDMPISKIASDRIGFDARASCPSASRRRRAKSA
jgi:hypothetical protein